MRGMRQRNADGPSRVTLCGSSTKYCSTARVWQPAGVSNERSGASGGRAEGGAARLGASCRRAALRRRPRPPRPSARGSGPTAAPARAATRGSAATSATAARRAARRAARPRQKRRSATIKCAAALACAGRLAQRRAAHTRALRQRSARAGGRHRQGGRQPCSEARPTSATHASVPFSDGAGAGGPRCERRAHLHRSSTQRRLRPRPGKRPEANEADVSGAGEPRHDATLILGVWRRTNRAAALFVPSASSTSPTSMCVLVACSRRRRRLRCFARFFI